MMSAPEPDLKLKPLDVPGLPDSIEIPEGGLTLGRDGGNEVVLDGERFPYTSSYHARVSREAGGLVVEDLDSKNGTLVNDKTVQRQSLKAGDVIQLGREIGARFLVVPGVSVTETLDLGVRSKRARKDSMSRTAILRLRRTLGIPEHAENLGRMVRGNRRTVVAALLLFCVLAFAVGYGFVYLLRSQREEFSQLRGIGSALEESLSKFTDRLAIEELAREDQIARLESEKNVLLEKIDALEKTDRASKGGIEDLRRQLKDTNTKLEQYNPINLEKEAEAQRGKLRRVLDSIVYIEKKIAFREKDGDRYLHGSGDSPDPKLRKPEKKEDLYYDAAASASGFCVSEKGWIVTNAHVVKAPEIERPLKFGETILVMEPVLDVIFSGTSTRHSSKTVAIADEGDDDFALLKIEPFSGMPFIEDFAVSAGLPPPGAEVRLFGFPLGKILLQEKSNFTASVFAGIVSRKADAYIQVQAAVYPGNSGGPAVDEDARVFGIVTGVQTVPGGQIASDIGFVLPIGNLTKIWPPDEEEVPKKAPESPDGKDRPSSSGSSTGEAGAATKTP